MHPLTPLNSVSGVSVCLGTFILDRGRILLCFGVAEPEVGEDSRGQEVRHIERPVRRI